MGKGDVEEKGRKGKKRFRGKRKKGTDGALEK